MESLDASDPRREWFISLDRARRYKRIHPENRVAKNKSTAESLPPVPLLSTMRSADTTGI